MNTDTYILGGWQSDFAQKAPDAQFFPLLRDATHGALHDADQSYGRMPLRILVIFPP